MGTEFTLFFQQLQLPKQSLAPPIQMQVKHSLTKQKSIYWSRLKAKKKSILSIIHGFYNKRCMHG